MFLGKIEYCMRLIGLKNIKRIYFIGIGGISMSALALLLQDYGYQVSGSDAVKGEQTEKLLQKGCRFTLARRKLGRS